MASCSIRCSPGSILGPLLFIVYSNDIQSYIQTLKLAFFADDFKLYLPQVEPNATYHLHNDLDNLIIWTTDNQMEFNNTKCKALRITGKKTHSQTNYTINGHIIEQVTAMKDLGVIVLNDLSWSQRIETTVSKANKILGFIKRICKGAVTIRNLCHNLSRNFVATQVASEISRRNTPRYHKVTQHFCCKKHCTKHCTK